MGVGGDVDLDLDGGPQGLALHLGHGLGHELHIEVVAHRGDVAGLVLAQQVARPPDLEVAHGDLEPGPELGLLADGPQPLIGGLGQHLVGGMEEIGVGALARAPHPAPELVELAQPEAVGAIDHEGVHGGHVDPRLDDGGAHQDVEAFLPEVEHDLLECALVHLPVRHGHARLGDEHAQARRDGFDVLHPVVHEEGLAFAQQLPAQRFDDGGFLELAHVGEDRLARRRRCVDEREVADAGEGHLEGTGDGVGREGQHVDTRLPSASWSLCG